MGNGFLASVRAIFFYAFTLITAIPLFVLMVAIFPFVWLFDKYKCASRSCLNPVAMHAAPSTAHLTVEGQICLLSDRMHQSTGLGGSGGERMWGSALSHPPFPSPLTHTHT